MAKKNQPNILILCMDQWQTHMRLPEEVRLPALGRLESRGVSFDRQYCTVPICTPSRATMWTGVHAKLTGLWDNTNFAWIGELSRDIPTIGHLLREQGYYTAFKGKWHLSTVAHSEDALEPYGFSDYQQWGDMFGAPLQGAMLDGAAAFEAVDWLEHKATALDKPWLLVCSIINPHDVMFLQTDPVEEAHPRGAMTNLRTGVQRLGWFQEQWDVDLPPNFDDDLALQPAGVREYREFVELNYGKIPEGRSDLWLARRNYLINCMRLADLQFQQVLAAVERLDLWKDTVVILTGDHGEMNGGHRMAQKGAIHFDETTIVNLTVCAPEGPQGARTRAVGSHLDLAPTLLAFAGLTEEDVRRRYPHLKGRSLKGVVMEPSSIGPRGDARTPGDGALICWDGLHSLDAEWSVTGALEELTDMSVEEPDPSMLHDYERRRQHLHAVGRKHGAPDLSKRTFFRCVVDGRYKLVRWFSPYGYGLPRSLDELYETGDVTLHDLVEDPHEMENIGNPAHPRYRPELVESMREKLVHLIAQEMGEDGAPFELDLFGTREVKYRSNQTHPTRTR